MEMTTSAHTAPVLVVHSSNNTFTYSTKISYNSFLQTYIPQFLIQLPNTLIVFRYKICLIGTDGTNEAEFLFFGAMGQRLVHKDAKMLMRSCHKADEIPTQITSLVSQKYLLTINVTNKCFERAHRSYQVNAINCAYGRQPTIPTVTNPTPRLTRMKRKGDSYEATAATDPSLEEPHQINIPALPQVYILIFHMLYLPASFLPI